MAQLWYDVMPHRDGWAIVITSEPQQGFATRIEAFDAAADLAHRLRYRGCSLSVEHAHDVDGKEGKRRGRAICYRAA